MRIRWARGQRGATQRCHAVGWWNCRWKGFLDITFQTVKLTRNTDGTAVLTLNRPAVPNSINQQMIQELRTVLAEVAHDERGNPLAVRLQLA
jgi:1,4-dihydroxy-2-naphthoyl-CoA synthase